jgi:hypothetical protein
MNPEQKCLFIYIRELMIRKNGTILLVSWGGRVTGKSYPGCVNLFITNLFIGLALLFIFERYFVILHQFPTDAHIAGPACLNGTGTLGVASTGNQDAEINTGIKININYRHASGSYFSAVDLSRSLPNVKIFFASCKNIRY